MDNSLPSSSSSSTTTKLLSSSSTSVTMTTTTTTLLVDDAMMMEYGSINASHTSEETTTSCTMSNDELDYLIVGTSSSLMEKNEGMTNSPTSTTTTSTTTTTWIMNLFQQACRGIWRMHETTTTVPIVVADEHGHLLHYPNENKDIQQQRRRQLRRRSSSQIQTLWNAFWKNNNTTCCSIKKWLECFKCFFSMTILFISIYTVMIAMMFQQTVATYHGLPIGLAIVFFWFLIFWLAAMEGEQACLVGLQPIPKNQYKTSHPWTFVSTKIAHDGNNMECYIVGRQFLVCLVVFASNLLAATIDNAIVPTLSDTMISTMLSSGIAVTLIAIILGQSAQINAANCMLDFINNTFMIFTTYASLLLDMSGLLHSVYLFQILFSKFTNTTKTKTTTKTTRSTTNTTCTTTTESSTFDPKEEEEQDHDEDHEDDEHEEPSRTIFQQVTFWFRVIFSTMILFLSLCVTIAAIWNNETTMYHGVPKIVSIILLFGLLTFVGILEGMQIALFAVVNLPKQQDDNDYPNAAKCCSLTFTGCNLQAFLIGRQLCVAMCMFVVAKLTSCNVELNTTMENQHNNNIFGVNNDIQALFNTGMLGAFITTVIGSLVWRILASCFPIVFLSNPIMYWIIQLCLIVEISGICSAAWPLAWIQKQYIFHYQLDEYYLLKEETDETEKETDKEDDDDKNPTPIVPTTNHGDDKNNNNNNEDKSIAV